MKSEVSLFLFNKMHCNFEVAGIPDGTLRNESNFSPEVAMKLNPWPRSLLSLLSMMQSNPILTKLHRGRGGEDATCLTLSRSGWVHRLDCNSIFKVNPHNKLLT